MVTVFKSMGYPENPAEDDNHVVRPPSTNVIFDDDDMDINNDSDDDLNAYNGYQPLNTLDDDNTNDMLPMAINEPPIAADDTDTDADDRDDVNILLLYNLLLFSIFIIVITH